MSSSFFCKMRRCVSSLVINLAKIAVNKIVIKKVHAQVQTTKCRRTLILNHLNHQFTRQNRMDIFHKNWFTQISPDDAKRLTALAAKNKADKKGNSSDHHDSVPVLQHLNPTIINNDGIIDDGKRANGWQQHGGGGGGEAGGTVRMDGEEVYAAWSGQAFSLEVEQELFHAKSKYQDISVFRSKAFGNVLIIDGIIQSTDRYEFAFQELLVHLPMFSHPGPKKVLIVGGGDGFILGQVLKHQSVEQVVICEIDEVVVQASTAHLEGVAESFRSPKLQLNIGDGFAFLKEHKGEFDVIITDSTDPFGPSESLFGRAFLSLANAALRDDDGVFACVAQSIWLHLPMIEKMLEDGCHAFPSVAYAHYGLPTFPSGTIGFLLATKKKGADLRKPVRHLSQRECEKMGLNLYNAKLHESVFVLPNFARKLLTVVSKK